jgi:outer membrane protein OmpA-like peptidoglycan-associated protein
MRYIIVLGVLILVSAGIVRAQTPADSADAARHTAEQVPNVTVVQDGRAIQFTGVWQVRRRIATLPRRPNLPLRQRTVVAPVVIITGGLGQRVTAPAQRRRGAGVGVGQQSSAQAPTERDVDVIMGDADRRGRQPVAPTPDVVERQLLETGLFRTVDVMFEFDRSTLLPRSEVTLDAVGEVMTKYPSLSIEVAGHTDSVGSERYNQRLSERRATAVRQYLLGAFDIAPQRILAVGFGEARPVATNATETGRALNRRVEFVVRNPGVIERR